MGVFGMGVNHFTTMNLFSLLLSWFAKDWLKTENRRETMRLEGFRDFLTHKLEHPKDTSKS